MAPLSKGLELLESAIGYALAAATLGTPQLLSRPTPCAGWDLEMLLDHVSDSIGVLHEAIATEIAGASAAPMGNSTRPDPVARLRGRASGLLGACAAAGPGGRLVSVGDRELTASMVTITGAIEIAVHGWDITVACAGLRPVPPNLATALLAIAPLLIGPDDRPGLFAEPVRLPGPACPGDQLVAFLGRRPHPRPRPAAPEPDLRPRPGPRRFRGTRRVYTSRPPDRRRNRQEHSRTGVTTMSIANKAVLVTGANRGIGRALVDEALRRGAAQVYAGTRRPLAHPDGRVTPLLLDVTSSADIQAAADQVGSLDILINNAGIALYDDLSDRAALDQQLAVNLFGSYSVTTAFLPALIRSGGAIVNNVSTMALAPLPLTPAYSVSKAAAFSMTQSLRALLAGRGVSVHAVLTGPTDTDMTRGFDIPKASAESVARAIFDGVENNEEDIFPDPMSQSVAEGWRSGVDKALERQYAAIAAEFAAVA